MLKINITRVLLMLVLSVLGVQGMQAQVASNVTFRDNLTYSADMSDIWGWRNPADGREYAIATLTNGVSLVEVTDPDNIVERDFISGTNTLWRDAKTWGDYAYVTNEGGGGLLIIEMSDLPGSVSTFSWNGGIGFNSAHNIFIDENGYGYLCGSNGSLGTVIIDLNANPTNPPVVGSYTTRYVHDLYVEDDIMYTAEINNGIFSVVDVTNKAAPVVLATQSTSSNFTHNIWLSADGDYVFTTDEVNGANVDAYNISDLSDIQEVDRFRPGTPGSSSIPHNTFVVGNFLFTAWYRDGLRITDATIPENMIEVGWYDTSPFSGGGFNGAWGTYPYLPSGNVLVTDIEEGLFVLTPSYIGAAFLAGSVTDASTSGLIFDADVSISGGPTTSTDVFGQYQTGLAGSGTFSVTVSKPGYVSQTITGVSLTAGSTTTLNVALVPNVAITVSGQVTDAASGAAVSGAQLQFIDGGGNVNSVTANAAGNYTINLFSDTYTILTGDWGYETKQQTSTITTSSTVNIALDAGFYDDFTFDFGWTENSNATTGVWTRGEPVGTDFDGNAANPELDITTDFSDQCYMTGNGGGAAGTDDVDAGRTTLISPVFDLSGYTDPYIEYSRWFFNDGGSGSPNDSLLVTLSNGASTVTLELVTNGDPAESTWKESSYRVSDFITPTANMRIRFASSDLASAGGHLVESGVDGFAVVEGGAPTVCATPTNLVASGITAAMVTVSWDPVPSGNVYQVEGRKAGTTTFRAFNTFATSRTVNNLSSNTTYEWRARVQCLDGSISAFSPLQNFTTLSPRLGATGAKIVPNPASEGHANLRIDAIGSGRGTVEVFSFDGRRVVSKTVEVTQGPNMFDLNTESLRNGMYLVNFEMEGYSWSGRLQVMQ